MQSVLRLILPVALATRFAAASNADVDAPHHIMSLSVASVKVEARSTVAVDDDAPRHTMALSVARVQVEAFSEMERVFSRSDQTHRQSMDVISKSLSLPKAIQVIQHLGDTGSELKKLTSLLSGGKNLRTLKDDGFGGLDGARRLLNSMIHESMMKYDQEIAKCTDYYAKQCALMEIARGQISAANFIAANSRALILDAQAVINQMEMDIPATSIELKDHNLKCRTELRKMNDRLKLLLEDVAIMTMILEMSDCSKKLIQVNAAAKLKCQTQLKAQCSNDQNPFFSNPTQLKSQLDKLQSNRSRALATSALKDMFDDSDKPTFLQVAGSGVTDSDDALAIADNKDALAIADGSESALAIADGSETAELPTTTEAPKEKVKMMRGPNPRTLNGGYVGGTFKGGPLDPTDDSTDKLADSPQCFKIAQKFLQIQAGIIDDRDALMEEIESIKDSCEDTKKTLEDSIDSDRSLLSSSQTKLAAATEKEASAGEKGRQVAAENKGYNDDLMKQMKICSQNYIDFETEICALRKIRGDVFKKMKDGHKGFFQDCEVSQWTPEACSAKCAGGDQKLIRAVVSHPGGENLKEVGAKCLPLTAEKRCNRSPCPVDCSLEPWGGWAKCSSKCGGGLATRVRDVKMPMQYDGKPCSATSEAKQCNVAACEKNCVLHEWTRWTGCSKHCDGGSMKRQKMIKEVAEGAGTCAGEWSPERLQYRACAEHRCKVAVATEVMKCNKSLDIVLVLDQTPKTGKTGFAAMVTAANLFVDGFSGPLVTAVPNFAIITYNGPRNWKGVSKCTGKSTEKVDMEKTCRIKIAQHFDEDMKKVKGVLNALEYAPGSKLLSLGLMAVQSEMALGRKESRSIVIVFIDGQPLSYRKTMLTSHTLRKKARLLYVVVAKFAPLADIKKWASRRWQENLVKVNDATGLLKAETGTHIMANICPRAFPKLKVARRSMDGLMLAQHA